MPEASEDLFGDDGVLAAYARRCSSPDPEIRERAAARWCAWEDALIAHESAGRPGADGDRPQQDRLSLVRICAHYFAHAAWLDEDVLLHGAARLAEIPAVLLHGQLDLSSPLETAWQLAQAWPSANLVIVEDAGHTGSPNMGRLLRNAYGDIADRANQLHR